MSNIKLEELDRKFNDLSNRDQKLLFGSIIVLLVLIGYYIVFEPNYKSIKKEELQISGLKIGNDEKQNKITDAVRRLAIDPDAGVKKEIKTLTQQLAKEKARLAQAFSGLVDTGRMVSLMETVLSNSSSLKIVKIESLPSEPLSTEIATDYFKHPVRFQFVGRYLDLLSYLKLLESLDQRYYWDSLDYTVGDYPIAAITLNVFTLGKSKDFIGGKENLVGGQPSDKK